MKLAAEQRLFIKKDDRVATKKLRTNLPEWLKNLNSEETKKQRKDNLKNRKNITIEIKTQELMLAVSANRTRVHWGQNHFCRKHNLIVNKNHIDKCDLINN